MGMSKCQAMITDHYAVLDLSFWDEDDESKGLPFATITITPLVEPVPTLEPNYVDLVTVLESTSANFAIGDGPSLAKGIATPSKNATTATDLVEKVKD